MRVRTAQQLRDSHGWTSEDTAELQYNMLAAPSGRYPDSLVPKVLPNDDRNGKFDDSVPMAHAFHSLGARLILLVQRGPPSVLHSGQ